MAELNKYGVCLEPKMKCTILDDIGKHFLDRAAELVKSGQRFRSLTILIGKKKLMI